LENPLPRLGDLLVAVTVLCVMVTGGCLVISCGCLAITGLFVTKLCLGWNCGDGDGILLNFNLLRKKLLCLGELTLVFSVSVVVVVVVVMVVAVVVVVVLVVIIVVVTVVVVGVVVIVVGVERALVVLLIVVTVCGLMDCPLRGKNDGLFFLLRLRECIFECDFVEAVDVVVVAAVVVVLS
jgi:hypothetical protein